MSFCWRKILTAFLILTVIYVFVSPVFALDPSANRAWRAALQVLLSIALLASALFSFRNILIVCEWISELMFTRGRPHPALLSSVCLC